MICRKSARRPVFRSSLRSLTPSAMCFPSSRQPPFGTILGSMAAAAPVHLTPSLTHATNSGRDSSAAISVGQLAIFNSETSPSCRSLLRERAQIIWASVAEVVSVPGPSISFASDKADCVESLDPAIAASNEIPGPFSKSSDPFN